MIVLDTNVISELVRKDPCGAVLENVKLFPSRDLYTTAITEAEIRLGLAILPGGRKQRALQVQVNLILEEDFAERILPFDSVAAEAYANLVASRRTAGRPISQSDAQIAAIVSTREAVLLTRNVRDFSGCGIEVVNPWNPPNQPAHPSHS